MNPLDAPAPANPLDASSSPAPAAASAANPAAETGSTELARTATLTGEQRSVD